MQLQIKHTSITNPEVFMELLSKATAQVYITHNNSNTNTNNNTNNVVLENNKDTSIYIKNLCLKEHLISIIVHSVKDYYNFLYYSMFGY